MGLAAAGTISPALRPALHTSRAGRSRRPQPTRAMLLEHLPALEGRRIVLASASPRRRELLSAMGVQFEVRLCGVAAGRWQRECCQPMPSNTLA